jgi:hypothetical protein
MSRFAMIFAFGLLSLFFSIYLIFRFQHYWQGGRISIFFPDDFAFLTSSHLIVKGSGLEVSRLELNGRPIYTDQNGFWEEELILAPGLNIIELKADDRFGRKLSEKRTVMVKMPE